MNQAAEQFADAVRVSYRAVADRGESAQELNAQLTKDFFNRVIDDLQTQARDAREMGRALADQQQRGQEAARQLMQESVGAYMDFMSSLFSMGQAGPEAAKRAEEESR